MVRLIALTFAIALATSAQAMSLIPPDQHNGMIMLVREACGAGMHMVNGQCQTTVLRRQTRRCLLFDAGGVCRKWG